MTDTYQPSTPITTETIMFMTQPKPTLISSEVTRDKESSKKLKHTPSASPESLQKPENSYKQRDRKKLRDLKNKELLNLSLLLSNMTKNEDVMN
jgi:hypothetical protein